MKKLSFIVPVYNVAPYLRKCVESLIKQDFSDYEIILVDDGSTDNSPQICDEYVRAFEIGDCKLEIKCIHQKNGGLSAARNAGLKEAKGEYVCFVDSDDYWQPNVLGELMAQIERDNLDVLRFNYQNVNEQYEVFYPNKNPKRDVNYSTTVTDGECFLNERLGPACYAVMFILRRDLIIEEQSSLHHSINSSFQPVLFTPGIYFEDTDWTPRMLVRAKRVASTPMIVYNYLWRKGSITLPTDPEKRKKVLRDKISLLCGFKEQTKLVKDQKWFTWMMSSIAMGVLNHLASIPSTERKPYLNELKALHVFPLIASREKVLSHRIKIIIANISPAFYCRLMSIRK